VSTPLLRLGLEGLQLVLFPPLRAATPPHPRHYIDETTSAPSLAGRACRADGAQSWCGCGR
jgi:hypothetical protein